MMWNCLVLKCLMWVESNNVLITYILLLLSFCDHFSRCAWVSQWPFEFSSICFRKECLEFYRPDFLPSPKQHLSEQLFLFIYILIPDEKGIAVFTLVLPLLPLTVSCFRKVQIAFTFPAVKGVCVCVFLLVGWDGDYSKSFNFRLWQLLFSLSRAAYIFLFLQTSKIAEMKTMLDTQAVCVLFGRWRKCWTFWKTFSRRRATSTSALTVVSPAASGKMPSTDSTVCHLHCVDVPRSSVLC